MTKCQGRFFMIIFLVLLPLVAFAKTKWSYVDSAASNVLFSHRTCLSGIILSGDYKLSGQKSVSYLYLHLYKPVNVMPISMSGDHFNGFPLGHQYDFEMGFATPLLVKSAEMDVGRNVEVCGVLGSSPTQFSPTATGIVVFEITRVAAGAAVPRVCCVAR